MSIHTQGPWDINWYICKEGKEELWRVTHSIGPISVDHNHWAGNYIDVSEEDARLISAAPDLLEALLDMISDRECLSEATINFACAAIAKATGGTA